MFKEKLESFQYNVIYSVTVKSKSTDIKVKMFLKYWISLFDSPNTVFSDNKGEFVSKEFIDFCENFNITTDILKSEKWH